MDPVQNTFHVSGKLNTHNVRIWESQNPHVTRELERDIPKGNVRCGVMCNRIIGPFLSDEPATTANLYLDLLTEYVALQPHDLQPTFIVQQDGAPPHWRLHIRELLNETRPVDWKGWPIACLATSFTRHHSLRVLSVGLC
jgi:hypothetical protein